MTSEYWDAPLCLVENTPDHGLQINEHTMARLREVRVPAAVVGIAGVYRQGKSYLMNRLAGKQKGFVLGSAVESMTKGIWIWVRPHPLRADCCLILLDTEGLSDPQKGDKNHDTWIFALTILLSSTFVYNSIGTLTNDAVADLHFVAQMSEHIKVKANSDEDQSEAFKKIFPSFVWAVRDFTLDLTLDGREISSDEYLEKVALKLKTGASPAVYMYNMPRDCIRNYFPDRKCFCFPRPVNSKEGLKRLETLTLQDLDPEFVQISQVFCQHVWSNTAIKTVHGKLLTGSMVGELTRCYVKAIQEGAVPCIESAVETTAKIENTRAIENSVELYRSVVTSRVQFPTDDLQQLSAIHHEADKAAIANFLKNSIFDKDSLYQKRLAELIQEEYNNFVVNNEQASERKCTDLLNQLYSAVRGKQESGVYAAPGGYQVYSADMDQVIQQYRATPGKGVKAESILTMFLSSKEADGKAILFADEKLKEEEKKAEEERQKAAAAEQAQKAAEEEQRKTAKLMEDKEKSYKENVEQLHKKMQEDSKRMMEENERLLAKRLKEQHDLLEQGFKEKSQSMNKELEDLRHQIQQQNLASGGGPFSMLGGAIDGLLGAYSGIKGLFKK